MLHLGTLSEPEASTHGRSCLTYEQCHHCWREHSLDASDTNSLSACCEVVDIPLWLRPRICSELSIFIPRGKSHFEAPARNSDRPASNSEAESANEEGFSKARFAAGFYQSTTLAMAPKVIACYLLVLELWKADCPSGWTHRETPCLRIPEARVPPGGAPSGSEADPPPVIFHKISCRDLAHSAFTPCTFLSRLTQPLALALHGSPRQV